MERGLKYPTLRPMSIHAVQGHHPCRQAAVRLGVPGWCPSCQPASSQWETTANTTTQPTPSGTFLSGTQTYNHATVEALMHQNSGMWQLSHTPPDPNRMPAVGVWSNIKASSTLLAPAAVTADSRQLRPEPVGDQTVREQPRPTPRARAQAPYSCHAPWRHSCCHCSHPSLPPPRPSQPPPPRPPA
jgi:hypothetical protein